MPLLTPEQFPFCGPSYLLPSPVMDAQRSINLYPESGIKGSKTQMGLTGRPGFAAFSNISGPTVGHSLFAGAGRLFAALGTHLYEIKNDGTALTDYGSGLSSLASPVPMIANGTQLLACDKAAGKVFNVNGGGPSLDLVFNGSALEYLDGFYISIAVGASVAGTNPNQVNVSANGDGTVWPALSYVIRTGAADYTNGLAVLGGLLFIFGQKTLEIWYDAGNNIFPFARVANGQVNLGCLAPDSIVKFSNTILWLGSDETGYGQVYMMQGMNPLKVSNAAIEYMISTLGPSQLDLVFSKAYGYQEAGHIFYVLNLCDANYQTTATLVYDLTTGLWHERAWSTIVPTGFSSVPDFGASIPNFVCDELSGKIYYQSIQYPSDAGATITYTRTAPHVGSENRAFKYPRFELDIDPQATGSAGTIAPVLDYSNNGGRSFLGYNYALAQNYDQAFPGGFQRFYARQLGRSRDRVLKVSITDSTNLIRIANAYLTAEPTE